MDWPHRQSSGTEHSGLPPALGVKLPGSIPDSVDASALLFNESLMLGKRELRNLSKSLQEGAIEILRQEAQLILNDVCAQVAKEYNTREANELHLQLPGMPPPAVAIPSKHGELKNTADLHFDHHRPFLANPGCTDFSVDSTAFSIGNSAAVPQIDMTTDFEREQSGGSSKMAESNGSPKSGEGQHLTRGDTRDTRDTPTRRLSVASMDASRRSQGWAKSYAPAYRGSTKLKKNSKDPTTSSNNNEMLTSLQYRFSMMQTQKTTDFKVNRIGRLVTSDGFDYVFGLILVLNALTMGVQADYEAQNLGQNDPSVFAILDLLFCVAFVFELTMRFYVFRLSYYFMSGWQWAYFDTVIVAMQTFEELMKVVSMIQNEGRSEKDETGGVFKVLKLLKVGRLLRMVRMVRLIPELKSMVYLIFASMSAFLWSIVLLAVMVYGIAVYLTMMATDVLVEKGIEATEELTQVHLYWGSLGDSIMSLYWSITGGQDWGDLIQPLVVETGSQIHNVIFAMYIAFATMVIMNLVTGVFVEGAQRLTKEDKDKEAIKIAYKTFNAVDDDDNVEITNDELTEAMTNGHMDPYLEAINLQRQECLDLFKLLDVDGSGTISLQEFTHGCLKLRGQARAADVAQLLIDVREVKDEVTKELDSLNEKYKSVAEAISVWYPFAEVLSLKNNDLGCEV